MEARLRGRRDEGGRESVIVLVMGSVEKEVPENREVALARKEKGGRNGERHQERNKRTTTAARLESPRNFGVVCLTPELRRVKRRVAIFGWVLSAIPGRVFFLLNGKLERSRCFKMPESGQVHRCLSSAMDRLGYPGQYFSMCSSYCGVTKCQTFNVLSLSTSSLTLASFKLV